MSEKAEKSKDSTLFTTQVEQSVQNTIQVDDCIDQNERKEIHYLFDQFKKASDEKSHDIAKIGLWAYKNKDYDRAKAIVNKVTHEASHKPADFQKRNSTRYRGNSNTSRNQPQFAEKVARSDKRAVSTIRREGAPPVVTLEELKDRFHRVKEDLSNFESMQDSSYLDQLIYRKGQTSTNFYSKKTATPPPAKRASSRPSTSSTTATKDLGMYEKYVINKSKVFATNGIFHPETGLLAITFLSREARIYSPRYRFEEFIFLEKHRLRFSSVPLFIVFSTHQKIKAFVMAIATEDSLLVFKLNEAGRKKEYYVEQEPLFKVTAPSYKVKEPIGFM